MKCEYCNKEIPAGSEFEVEGHFFCNSLHRYNWYNGIKYDETKFNSTSNTGADSNEQAANDRNQEAAEKFLFDKTRPMNLGDIFNVTFNLIKTTFSGNFLIAAIFLIPAGILLGFGMQSYFTNISSFIGTMEESGVHKAISGHMINMISSMALYFLTLVIFMLAYIAALIGITDSCCEAMENRKPDLKNVFAKIFSVTYLQSIGMGLFIMLVIIGSIIAGGIVLAIAEMTNNNVLKFLAGIIIFAEILYLVFLYIRWYFSFISLVHAKGGIVKSFSNSSNLVRGYWWRTFGIIILISILVNFAVSIISTPIYFSLMWGYLSQYFKLLAGSGMNKPDPKIMLGLFKTFGHNLGLVMMIGMMLHLLIGPLFNVVLYFDLKIRRHDYDQNRG